MTVVPLLIKDLFAGTMPSKLFRTRDQEVFVTGLHLPGHFGLSTSLLLCRIALILSYAAINEKKGRMSPPFCALLLLQFHYGDSVATLIKVSHPRGNDQAMFL